MIEQCKAPLGSGARSAADGARAWTPPLQPGHPLHPGRLHPGDDLVPPVSECFRRALATNPLAVAAVITELHRPVRDEAALLDLMQRAADVTLRITAAAQSVSVTARSSTRGFVSVATDPRVAALDEAQRRLGYGPWRRAVHLHEPVVMSRSKLLSTWPDLAEAVTEAGVVGSVAALPLSDHGVVPAGALTLYGLRPGPLGTAVTDLLTVVTEYVSRALAELGAVRSAEHQVAELQDAVRARTRVEQATGILMAVHRINSDAAFAMLLSRSRETSTSLHAVAAQVIFEHGAPVSDGAVDELTEVEAARDYHSAFDHAPIGMAIATPQGRLLAANAALGRLLGRSPQELVGTELADVTHTDDRPLAQEALRRLGSRPDLTDRIEIRLSTARGTPFHAVVSTAKVLDGQGTPAHLVMHVEDVTVQQETLHLLRELSTHDALTGLPNRLLLQDRLDRATQRNGSDGTPLSVLYVDLDDFKAVNDTHGHATGDALLVEVGRVLAEHVRPDDTVARVGGDEFVVLCEDADAGTAVVIAERITKALEAPLRLADVELRVQASIGTATWDQARIDAPAELLRLADQAMYVVKGRR